MLGYIVVVSIGAILPMVVFGFIPKGSLSLMSGDIAAPVIAFFYFLWLLVLWIILFRMWTTFYLDIWIITDHRVIDIDQRGLFSRDVATTWLEKLQDVEVETTGIFQTIFDYGTIKIYTAGENPNIIITNASHPGEARESLLSGQHKAEEDVFHQVAMRSPGAD